MSYEQRDMSGVLFRNDKKQSDNHPDYTGNCKIDGKDFWINAWLKTSNNGNKFFSFSFKPKEATKQQPQQQDFQQSFEPDGDIPF